MSKSNSRGKIHNYLESLTKDELITLILKFAPQSFIDNINSQFASKKEALTIFDKTSKSDFSKPTVAVELWDSERTSTVAKNNADRIVKWQSSSNVGAIKELSL